MTSIAPTTSQAPGPSPLGELAKLAAFLRRDFLVAWSYRLSFVTEWLTLAIQAITFYFVSKLISPSALPAYSGTHATYMQFVSIGIVVGALLQLAIGKIAAGVRGEQLMGTLESLLLTPTAAATIQIGTVAYDFIYIPIRMAIFLVVIAVVFGLHFDLSGIGPSVVLLIALLPFIWGIGIANAAATLTFRRGGSPAGLLMTVLALGSGTFFPLTVFPHAVATAIANTPVAIALGGIRRALIGGEGWSVLGWNLGVLGAFSVVFLLFGLLAFRLALRREWRRGSLGLY
jgi:ABC-2 type transport system permease protein